MKLKVRCFYVVVAAGFIFLLQYMNTTITSFHRPPPRFLAEFDVPSFPEVDERYPKLREKYLVPHRSLPDLRRALKPEAYSMMMFLLRNADALFEKYNITYFMGYDTLLGSQMFHDVVPWSSDCYLLVDDGFRALLLDIFVKKTLMYYHYGVRAYAVSDRLRLFHKNSQLPLTRKLNYRKQLAPKPFCDVIFYKQYGEKLFVMSNSLFSLSLHRADVFPLHLRPFGDLWLPAPFNTRMVVLRMLGPMKGLENCVSNYLDKDSKQMYNTQILCVTLLEHYPCVHKMPHKEGTIESLWLNGTQYYSVLVEEEFVAVKIRHKIR